MGSINRVTDPISSLFVTTGKYMIDCFVYYLNIFFGGRRLVSVVLMSRNPAYVSENYTGRFGTSRFGNTPLGGGITLLELPVEG